MLTIKKYANGRFFDTDNKKYVTKVQLAEMIKGKEKIKIILAKTGKDITKSVVASLPASQNGKANGKYRPILGKMAIKTRVQDHKKWIAKQFDKRMDTVLEIMNFPNKRQVVKLNTEVKKLAQKVEDLQKQQTQVHAKMKQEHKKEMEMLAQDYDQRLQMMETAPAAQNA